MTSTSDELLYHCPECGEIGTVTGSLVGVCKDDVIAHFYKDGDYDEECFDSHFEDTAATVLTYTCANCGHIIAKGDSHSAGIEARKILEDQYAKEASKDS